MQDNNPSAYDSLTPEQRAKVDAVVNLMFSQNTMHNPHPLLALLKAEQSEMTAKILKGIQ